MRPLRIDPGRPAKSSLSPQVGAPWRFSVSAEAPRQLDVELVEVDIAHALKEFGGPGVGQRLGQLVAPGLVLGLQGAELGINRFQVRVWQDGNPWIEPFRGGSR